MKLTREAIQRMISQKQGTTSTTIIEQGGGGGSQPSITLGPLLTSLNAEAMPVSEGYLHWTGSAWAFDTPTGGDPVDLTPYAQKTWVQSNFASLNDISGLLTKTEADGYYAPISFVKPYLPLVAGSSYPLTGSLYITGNSGITWVGGYGMLCFKPTSGWAGVTENQWGVGSHGAQGVIRSSLELKRYDGTYEYTIYDSSNLDPLNYIRKDGGTVDGTLNVKPYLNIQSSAGTNKISFNGNAPNIDIASGGMITFDIDSYVSHDATNDRLVIHGNNGLLIDSDTYVGSVVGGNQVATKGYIGSQLDSFDSYMQQWVSQQGYITETTANGRYLPLSAGSGKPLTGDLYLSEDLVINNEKFIYFKNHSGTLCDALSHSYDENSGIDTLYLGFDFRKSSHATEIYGNKLTFFTGTSARERIVITSGGNVGIGTTTPSSLLDVNGNARVNGLYLNSDQTDNLIISNNKIQMSVSGTPHNIVLFEGSTANLTSYAKFYERPMVKTGTNNGTPVYTNVALVSEVEAKQNIIHFLNTNDNDSEVAFSYLHLPLSNIGAGNASLDLSAYVTSSALTTALGAYLPLLAGSSKPLTGDLYLSEDLVINNEKYIYFKNHSGTLCDALSHSYDSSTGIDTLYLGFDFRKSSHATEIYGNKLTLFTGTTARERMVITSGGNVGIGTTTPSSLLDVNGNARVNGLYLNSDQTDNLIISNNKIQMSVSGTPHNIVLFEGSTANLTSYAKFYERPMVKTGTNNGTPVYTNVALVSEVEAKQNIIHFLNTNDNDSEVAFSYLHLPLSNIGAGHASLDFSSYMPLSGDSTKDGNMIVTGKMAVGTTAFDTSNAKLQVTGNMFATGSITSKSNYGNVSLGNGNISATNLYISTVVFGDSNNDAAIYVEGGHIKARNASGTITTIV